MLTKRWGICGNPHTGYPDGTYARITQLGWLRALVLDTGSWEAMYNQMPNTTNIAAVITGQSLGLNNDFWSDGWRDRFRTAVTAFCEQFYKKVRLIEFTNEWDFWDNADRAEKAAEIAILGTDICKQYGILGMLGSVASSDWKAELARAVRVLDAADKRLGYSSVHGVCFHPYVSYVQRHAAAPQDRFVVPSSDGVQPADGWERLSDKVREAYRIGGNRPVAITELGIKVGDAGGVDKQSLYVHGVFQDELAQFDPSVLLMATYFCWTDSNGSPGEQGDNGFGLIGVGDVLRPAYHAATYQMQNAPTVDVPITAILAGSRVLPPQGPPDDAGGTVQPPNGAAGPGTQVPVKRTLTSAEAHELRWRAVVPSAVYNHDFGFERHWRMPENSWWGSPITESEYTHEDGRPLRIFANAVVAYNGDDTTEVL